jgi:transposase
MRLDRLVSVLLDMTTTIKCRLYPTKQQERQLEQTLDGCRWIYNYFRKKSMMTVEDMQFALTELKESHPWLRNYYLFYNKSLKQLRRTGRGLSRKLFNGDNYRKHRHMRARQELREVTPVEIARQSWKQEKPTDSWVVHGLSDDLK